MKTKMIILLTLWGICTLGVKTQAQTLRKLQPLKEFGKDTMAFLNKNFNERPLYSEGRNLKTFIEEINKELPIKSFRVMRCLGGDCIRAIDFYYYTIDEIKRKAKKNIKIPAIQYNIMDLVSPEEPLYKEIQKMGIDMHGKLMPWHNKYLEVLNKLKTDYIIVNEYYEL